jgi:2-hydroxychromene-2-carboxylate isomerase
MRDGYVQRALEFLFDYGSPFSYLVDTQLADVVKRTDAQALRGAGRRDSE